VAVVVIKASGEWMSSAMRLKRLAERLGLEARIIQVPRGFEVLTGLGVYSDPDRASAAVGALARILGAGSRG
jgi:hypothetical protein